MGRAKGAIVLSGRPLKKIVALSSYMLVELKVGSVIKFVP